MKILNFGSINIDHVYSVPHFVRAGETLPATAYQVFAGGKGLNQSIALAKAGAEVWHAGKVGRDAGWIMNLLRDEGVDTLHIAMDDIPTGHAIIQVNQAGENSILLFGGGNQSITSSEIDHVLSRFDCDDYLLIQNEINRIPELINKAKEKGMKIIFNPAPITSDVKNYPLELVDLLILNEVEGKELTNEHEPEKILDSLQRKYRDCKVVLTLGEKGSIYRDRDGQFAMAARSVIVADTTAAGDTFIGFLLAQLIRDSNVERAMQIATIAASICVTRPGAAISIPTLEEVVAIATGTPLSIQK